MSRYGDQENVHSPPLEDVWYVLFTHQELHNGPRFFRLTTADAFGYYVRYIQVVCVVPKLMKG